MAINKASNYDLMRDEMQKEFLKYDAEPMIKKYKLKHNNPIQTRF